MASTIKDVARLAGVSASTVSRVLHDNSRISRATKQRVSAAMAQLDYHPNALARSLANSTTRTLGLILPNDERELFENSFFILAMRGISIEAKAAGYRLMYTFSADEREEVEYLKSYIHDNWVEGVLLFTSRRDDQCIRCLVENSFPFAVIGRPADPATGLWVDNDNVRAMSEVVDYLIGSGCRSIAFLGGPAELDVTINRLAGYRQSLARHGLAESAARVLFASHFDEDEAWRFCAERLAHQTVDAIVATDDILAFGAMRAMRESGRADIPIIGFNNTVRAQYQTPPLSSVEINPAELGARAARLLIDSLEGRPAAANHSIVATRFVDRSRPAAASARDGLQP